MHKLRIAAYGLLIVCYLVFLQLVFSGKLVLVQSLGPIAFPIRVYGITMAAALLVAFLITRPRLRTLGVTAEQGETIFLWVTIGGFIGGRMYEVLTNLSYYLHSPFEIVKIWHGGLGILGAIIGGLAAFGMWYRSNKKSGQIPDAATFLKFLDSGVLGILIGQIIGRLGNLFNYEAYGYPTRLPWAMYVPPAFRPPEFIFNNYFHPWFFYEQLVCAFLLLVFLWLLHKTKRIPQFPGLLFGLYLCLYNAFRLALEFLRIDSVFLGPFRVGVLVSGYLFFCGAGLLIYAFYTKPKTY